MGDHLDKRVAFSEGWSNAFAALVTGNTRYVDVFGAGQDRWFAFDVEGSAHAELNPGWFNEFSVQQIVYGVAEEGGVLGFPAVHAVLSGPHRSTDAQASIFSFLATLRTAHPEAVTGIEVLAAEHQIAPGADAFGSGETNAGHPPHEDALPVYHTLGVNQGARNVCSTDAFGAPNKLASRQFLRFSIDFSGTYTLTATTTSMPAGAHADPDMVLHRRGVRRARADGGPSEACVAGLDPAACVEQLQLSLTPGEYVLEVYEWTNTNDQNDAHPPIGRTCFDVAVTQ